MRTFSYTLSQKKHKKIKPPNVNRDPYLNHPTIIRSDYNNASGIKINEYINDIRSEQFIQFFNKFIKNTNTQDLSLFFDIDITNISANLTQLFTFNSDDIYKNINIEQFDALHFNKKYKNNYDFVITHEEPIKIKIKNIQDETFYINKNYNSSLQSFILIEDIKPKYIINDLVINLNENIKNPIDLILKDNNEKYNTNVMHFIQLSPIEINKNAIYENIIYEKNIIYSENEDIFSFNIQNNVNNEFMLLNETNKDYGMEEKYNYNFNINSLKKNKLFEEYDTDENIIHDKSELVINMVNINKLSFLDEINNAKNNNKNNNENNNDHNILNFYKIANYNFEKLNFINNSNENHNENRNEKYNITNDIIDDINVQSINVQSINIKNNFFKNNLQYLNDNVQNLNYNYEPNLNIVKINNKLNMISINSENIKIIEDKNDNILFSSIDKINLNMDNFIPKENLDKLNIYDVHTDLKLNINTDISKFNNFLNNENITRDDIMKEKEKQFILKMKTNGKKKMKII